jgi:hypothetical protein
VAATDRPKAPVIPAQAGIQRFEDTGFPLSRERQRATVVPAEAGIQRRSADGAAALLAAALALPGVVAQPAHAQTAPDQGVIGFRYFDYRDWQPGAQRMTVRSPTLYALKPLSDSLTLEGSLVYDAMSGASPLYFNTLSGASGLGITDYRTAADAKFTKYFDRFAIGIGGAGSSERDYLSRSLNVDLRTWTPDKNRTYAFGIAATKDDINPTNGAAEGKHKETYDFLFGITQNLNPGAVIQSNVTYSDGRGYYDDPYKIFDRRPDTRRVFAWLTRYNQYIGRFDATMRLSYRYISDSWHVDSHTFGVEWVQPLPYAFTLTPGLRYYSQHNAYFFYGPPLGQGFQPGQPYSADVRLAKFGGLTPSVHLAKEFPDGWSADLGMSFYRQKASWHLGGDGTPGILDFSARWLELGVQKTF